MKLRDVAGLMLLACACTRGTEDLGELGDPDGSIAPIDLDATTNPPPDASVPRDGSEPADTGEPAPACREICENGDCVYDVDLETVLVSGTISLTGADMSCEGTDTRLLFVNRSNGESFESFVSTGAYELAIYPGTYDVYAEIFCTARGARLIAADRALTSANNHLDVSLEVVHVSGAALLGMERIRGCPGLVGADEFLVRFSNIAVGETFEVRASTRRAPEYHAWIYPGTYDVSVVLPECRGSEAQNLSGEISIVEGAMISGETTLDLIIDAAIVSGELPEETATRIRFVEVSTGRAIAQQLGGFQGPFSFPIPRGQYDIYAGSYPQLVGSGGEFQIARGLMIDGDTRINYLRNPGFVRGCLTVDGAAIATMCPSDIPIADANGILSFVNMDTGQSYAHLIPQRQRCEWGVGSRIDAEVAPGRYDVYFTPENWYLEACTHPPGTIRGLIELATDFRVTAGQESELIADAVTVPVSVAHEGPDCTRVSFENESTEGSLLFDGRMYRSEFDIYADLERCNLMSSGPGFQRFPTPAYLEGRRTIARGATVDRGGESFSTSLAMRSIHGRSSFAGSPIPDTSEACEYKLTAEGHLIFDTEWRMSFTDRRTGDRFIKRLQGGTAYSLDMFPGTYDVSVSLADCDRQTSNAVLPSYSLVGERKLGCIVLR